MADELRQAVLEGRISYLQSFFSSNEYDPDTPQLRGATLLWIAAEHGHVEILQYLHGLGCNVQSPDDELVTPLYIASQNGHIDVVRFLLAAGADIDRCKASGATPLLIAAQEGHVDVVRVLYENGAEINQPMNNGITPFIAACFQGQSAVAAFLVLAGCDESCLAKDQPGIEWAAQEGHIECIAAVLEARVNRERLRSSFRALKARGHTSPAIVPPAGAEIPHLESWLYKRGGALKLWKRRWFTLSTERGHFLEYREQPGGPLISNIKPADMVSIENYNLEEKREKPPQPGLSDFAFCITATEPKSKTYILCANSEEERAQWVSLLRTVSEAEKSKQRNKPAFVFQIAR